MADFNWGYYLSLAREIETGAYFTAPADLYQAAIRTGISRAYYSAFHLAKDYAESKGATFTRFNTHQKVIDFYEKDWKGFLPGTCSSQCKIIKSQLFRMRRLRKLADYDCSCSFTSSKDVTSVITGANTIVAQIAKLPK